MKKKLSFVFLFKELLMVVCYHLIQTLISSLVCTAGFWNNFFQVHLRSLKVTQGQKIDKLNDLKVNLKA
jgi:uncharacterized membrane protein